MALHHNQKVDFFLTFYRCLLLALLVVLLITQSVYSQQSSFRIGSGQSIKVDNNRFSNLQTYFKSNYFRTSGKRCGADERLLARIRAGKTTNADSARSQGDCTTTLTRTYV